MPIYAIRVPTAYINDEKTFTHDNEPLGSFAMRMRDKRESYSKFTSSVGFMAAVIFAGLAKYSYKPEAGIKGASASIFFGLLSMLSASWCAVNTKAICKEPRTNRETRSTDIGFASTAIVGTFPDELIKAIIRDERDGWRQRYADEAKREAYIKSCEVIIKGKWEKWTRTFFKSIPSVKEQLRQNNEVDRIFSSLTAEHKFKINPSYKEDKSSTILYLVSDVPSANVLKEHGFLEPARNTSFKLYRRIDDAIDAYSIKHVSTVTVRSANIRNKKK